MIPPEKNVFYLGHKIPLREYPRFNPLEQTPPFPRPFPNTASIIAFDSAFAWNFISAPVAHSEWCTHAVHGSSGQIFRNEWICIAFLVMPSLLHTLKWMGDLSTFWCQHSRVIYLIYAENIVKMQEVWLAVLCQEVYGKKIMTFWKDIDSTWEEKN